MAEASLCVYHLPLYAISIEVFFIVNGAIECAPQKEGAVSIESVN